MHFEALLRLLTERRRLLLLPEINGMTGFVVMKLSERVRIHTALSIVYDTARV